VEIIILTAGSRGDIQPMIALGLELKKAGHNPRIVASLDFENLITSYGLSFVSTRTDLSQLMKSGNASEAASADNLLKMISTLRNKEFRKKLIEVQEDFYKICQVADLIIYHPGATIGYFAALEKRIPSIIASPFPIAATSKYPAIMFYRYKLPNFLNLITHNIFITMFWMISKPQVRYFLSNNVSKFFKLKNPIRLDPIMTSCSPEVFIPPKNTFCKGYWITPDPNNYLPSVELKEFLEKGDKPIYFGFGSVGNIKDAEKNTEIIIQSVLKAKKRAVIHTGYGGLSSKNNFSDSVYFIQEAPHSWLFPRMSVVVHHGGAGTTASAFHAGIPQIILPHGLDQFAWAKRVEELKVGVNLVNVKELNTEKLLEAITQAEKPEIKDNAKILGDKIRKENGAADAVDFISNYALKHKERIEKERKPIWFFKKAMLLLSIPIIIGFLCISIYSLPLIISGQSMPESLSSFNNLIKSTKPWSDYVGLFLLANFIFFTIIKPFIHWFKFKFIKRGY